MRLIDAELLMQKLSKMIDYCEKNKDKKFNALNVLFQVGDAIMDCPTVDVFERFTRCKDCDYCHEYTKWNGEDYLGCNRLAELCDGQVVEVDADDFCSYMNRRKDNER